jgi:hypothetical protein
MNSNIDTLAQGTALPTHPKALRRTICATLALAITALTTQVIIRSAGQHEYGMAAMQPPPAHSSPHDTGPDIRDSIVIARSP